MNLWHSILLLGWVAAGITGYLLVKGATIRIYYQIREYQFDYYWKWGDTIFCFVIGVFGPVGLIVAVVGNFFQRIGFQPRLFVPKDLKRPLL